MAKIDSLPTKACPQGSEYTGCDIHCRYNHFVRDDLVIHSWEVKCHDCGLRETVAYRSDDEDIPSDLNPAECPFCHLCDLSSGKDVCDGK